MTATIIFEAEIRDIANQEWLRERLLAATAPVVRSARNAAPVRRHGRSHGGAASIHAEAGHDLGGWFVDVSWDAAHRYMRYPNRGTRYIHAEHFLERAVRENERPT